MDQDLQTKTSSQKVLRWGIIVLSLLLIISAAAIPFLFESPSLYYKLGMDKVLLQTGKVLGLAAAMLMLYQILLICRIPWMEKVLGLKRLYSWHQKIGKSILLFVLLHPLMILGAENFAFYRLELRYWPEFVGIGLLLLILMTVIISAWRDRFSISMVRWRLLHRVGTPLIYSLLFIHILFVSESFELSIPRASLGLAASTVGLCFIWIYYRRYRSGK